nr:glutathione S-transferase 1-1-like [Onthophagus taurus]
MENETITPVFTKEKGVDNKDKMPNSNIDFYYFLPSPPCRSVMLLAKALGVQMNQKITSILAGDNMTPEYLRLNPQHTIPTLNDNGFILFESRAILQYLVDQYAKDDSLSPKEAKKAAIVNQRLYFDACTLMPRLVQYMGPVLRHAQTPDKEKLGNFEEALGYLDEFLENQTWAAGSQLTIADFALISTVSTAEAIGVDISKFPNVNAWFQRTKNAMTGFGYEEINQAGCAIIGRMFKNKAK